MASPTLRQAVFARYLASPALVALGFVEATIYPAGGPDSPASDRFMVLRWGITNPGIGVANSCSLGCWVYNREPDYVPISLALLEIRRILPLLEGVRMSPTEAVLGVVYNGDSDDIYDDGYRAWARYTTHTITASGS